MIVNEYGDNTKPVVVLIHGGGLSDWMWQPQIETLQNDYYLVTVILDGHGEAYEKDFDSIETGAQQIITYINQYFGGKVFAICGLSVGAQITVEILSRRFNIAQKAVVESARVIPMQHFLGLTKFMTSLSYPLAKKRWFAKLQAKQMYLPSSMFENYFADSSKMTKQSLLNLILSNSHYELPKEFANTRADVLVMCGEQELDVMKKSAFAVHQTALKGQLLVVPNCGHGVSIQSPQKYIKMIKDFFTRTK